MHVCAPCGHIEFNTFILFMDLLLKYRPTFNLFPLAWGMVPLVWNHTRLTPLGENAEFSIFIVCRYFQDIQHPDLSMVI